MNRWLKKLLAKYVTYIEIIGYGFVFLFVIGLILLSRIKAEDEFVGLNGKLNIDYQLFQADKATIILELLADTTEKVQAGQPVILFTDDEDYFADKKMHLTLNTQIQLAEKTGNLELVNQLKQALSILERKKYPSLLKKEMKSEIAGEFWLMQKNFPFAEKGEVIGGIFDFEKCKIHVPQLPVDKRMMRKLKTGQKGTASLIISPLEKIDLQVELVNLKEQEADLKIVNLTKSQKRKIAQAVTSSGEKKELSASISVLVGSKSWMQLIWR